jgi:hypothetical protein
LKTLESGDTALETMARFSLVALGKTEEVADDVVAALDIDDMYAPSILLDLYHRDPAAARAAIASGLETGNAKARATLSWIVAAVHDQALAEAIANLGNDTDEQVRAAAAWSLAWMNGAVPPPTPVEPQAAVPHDRAITSSATAP